MTAPAAVSGAAAWAEAVHRHVSSLSIAPSEYDSSQMSHCRPSTPNDQVAPEWMCALTTPRPPTFAPPGLLKPSAQQLCVWGRRGVPSSHRSIACGGSPISSPTDAAHLVTSGRSAPCPSRRGLHALWAAQACTTAGCSAVGSLDSCYCLADTRPHST